jgi:hypothetical protein
MLSMLRSPVKFQTAMDPGCRFFIIFSSFRHPHFDIYQLAASIHQNMTMESCLLVWALRNWLSIAMVSRTDTSHYSCNIYIIKVAL